jgi:predicted amidophosphoribosyltransferase
MFKPGASAHWRTLQVAGLSVPVIPFRCKHCANPIKAEFWETTERCASCQQDRNPAFSDQGIRRSWTLTTYIADHPDHPGTQLVKDSKASGEITAAIMEAATQEFLKQDPWNSPFESWKPDVVVPCPSSRERRIPRSFVIGDTVARRLNLPMNDILLRRDDHGPRSAQKRKTLPSTFTDLLQEVNIRAEGQFVNREKVLLADDMLTQGVTAASAAHALREIGAGEVRLLTFARYVTTKHLEEWCD